LVKACTFYFLGLSLRTNTNTFLTLIKQVKPSFSSGTGYKSID